MLDKKAYLKWHCMKYASVVCVCIYIHLGFRELSIYTDQNDYITDVLERLQCKNEYIKCIQLYGDIQDIVN